MSNREAELRIPEVMRANNLASSTRLTVGQKLVIPAEGQTKGETQPTLPEQKRAPRRASTVKKPVTAEPEQPVNPPETLPTVTVVTDKAESVPTVNAIEEIVSTDKPRLSVHSVTGSDMGQNLDILLTALSLPWG